jgi:hypothetical protein
MFFLQPVASSVNAAKLRARNLDLFVIVSIFKVFDYSILTQGVAIGLDLFKPLQGISGGYQLSTLNSQLSTLTPIHPFSF